MQNQREIRAEEAERIANLRQNQEKHDEQQKEQMNIEIYLLLLESICYGSVFEEPSDEMTEEEIKRIMSNNKNRLEKKMKLASEGKIEVLYIKKKMNFSKQTKKKEKSWRQFIVSNNECLM